MKEDELINKIKQEVDKVQQLKPNESAWGSFEKYRNQKDVNSKRKRSFFIPFLLGCLLMGLLSSTLFLFNENYQLKQKFGSLTQIDTVYLTKYIKAEKDEVSEPKGKNSEELRKELDFYRKAYQKSSFQKEILQSALLKIERLEGKLNALDKGINNQDLLVNKVVDMKTISSKQTEADGLNINTSDNTNPLGSKLTIEKIQFLNFQNPFAYKKYYIQFEPIFIPNTRTQNLWQKIKPKSFSIKPYVGFANNFNSPYSDGYGVNYGLDISSIVNSQWRIVGGVKYVSLFTKIKESGTILTLPKVTGPEDSNLKYVKLNSGTFTSEIGIDFLWKTKNRIRPYTGVGFALTSFTNHRFNYEFSTPDGEIYISKELHDNSFYKYIFLTGGIDINLSNRIDGNAFIKYGKSIDEFADWFNFNAGVWYHF